MKVFIVLACVAVSCASAGNLAGYGASPAATGYAPTGHSSQFRTEDNYGNYRFGYDESHATGSTGRFEERDGHVVRGSYNLYDADGRQRTVNYVADYDGFRATIDTNEPGVDAAREPAAVLINKRAYGKAAPAVAPLAIAGPAYGGAEPVPAYSAPAPVYARSAAPAYRAPLAPAYEAPAGYGAAPAYEASAPRAFSYSFGSVHPAMTYAAPTYGAPARAYATSAPAGPLYRDGPAY